MVSQKIVLFFIFFLTAYMASAELLCTDDTQHNSLSYRDEKRVLWDLTQFDFAKTTYTGSYLACSKYIEQLSNRSKSKTTQNSFKVLYPKENHTLRLKYTKSENTVFMNKCNDVPGCRLTFFQNIFNPKLLFKNKLKPDVFEDMHFCKNDFKEADFLLNEEPDRWAPATVAPAEFWTLPTQPLDESLFKFLDSFKPEKIYLSTMIPSLAILNRLDAWLIAHPETKATVMFAYNLSVLDDDFPNKFIFTSHRINLMPVYQTPETTSSYHVKGGVFIRKDQIRSLFYSVNLRRFREEKVADLAFLSSEKNLSLSLLGKFKDVIEFQCKNIKWLQCSQRLRYFDSDQRKKQIDQIFQTTCDNEFNTQTVSTAFDNVLMSGSSLLPDRLIEFIDSAKSEILISSHIYGHSLFHEAILRAKARGVMIRFLIGTEIEKVDFGKYLKANFEVKIMDRKSGYTSHAKFLIIDDYDVVWGTGNFTKTSMSNPFDIFIKSKDQVFKDNLKKYFYSFFKPVK